MDETSAAFLLSQAEKYRELGNAMRDRQTRLALLELAFEYEEKARRLNQAGTLEASPRATAMSRKSPS